MLDEKIEEKETLVLRKVYNHFIDNRSDIMKNTQFEVEDSFSVILRKECTSLEQKP